ncbi:hypothetical protein A0H76_1661 [Hepatospora eriocheir]|uniref:Uncharacterized protein n=1 Tax=Hepatospora eriocheir TaxID=1081669 RepID=A0A1X0QGN9_9MICR|nr:hypothetical protein A0H76_1661 [Hepatospora eriocheir]
MLNKHLYEFVCFSLQCQKAYISVYIFNLINSSISLVSETKTILQLLFLQYFAYISTIKNKPIILFMKSGYLHMVVLIL